MFTAAACTLMTLTAYLCSALVIRGPTERSLVTRLGVKTTGGPGSEADLKEGVKRALTGRYSNKAQADQDHALGKMTGAQGGHEFVTARISEHTSLENVLIATYYYGEDETAVFRHRLYELCSMDDPSLLKSPCCRMKLYRPTLGYDDELKNTQYVAIQNKEAPIIDNFEYLQGCDVVWKSNEDVYEGSLVEGECVICSQQDPTRIVKVRDDLRLTRDELWINDRVYTTDGTMIIGNVEGIPYKLKRV